MRTSYIREQLESALFDVSKKLGVSVAFDNAPFTPKVGQPWLRATLVPADTVMGTYSSKRYYGVFFVDVFDAPSVGAYRAEEKAAKIANVFDIGKNFGDVQIMQPPSVGNGGNDGEFFRVPIKIYYQCFN